MKIINAKVYTEAGIFEEKDVYTDGELIAEKSGDDQVLDAKGCYLRTIGAKAVPCEQGKGQSCLTCDDADQDCQDS